MNRKYRELGVVIIVVAIMVIVYVNLSFPFSPIGFESMPGTKRLKWYDFKNTVGLELEYWNVSPPENFWIENTEEVKFVYRQLTKSKIVDYEDYPDNRKRFVWFLIKNGFEGNVIQHVDVMENGIAETDEGIYIKVTDELWDFLVEIQNRNYIKVPLGED